LNDAKVEAFKARDQPTYVRVYREGQQKFQTTIGNYFKKGCEWIELEPENYQLSSKAYMTDQDKKQEVTKADAEVRLALETDPID